MSLPLSTGGLRSAWFWRNDTMVKNQQTHPEGRAFSSDWSTKSFNSGCLWGIILVVDMTRKFWLKFKKAILIDNHYKTTYGPVWTERSSCRLRYHEKYTVCIYYQHKLSMLKLDMAHVITKKKQRHNLRLQFNHSEKLKQFTYCLHDEWEFFGECRQIISSGLFSENKRDCLT